MSEEEIQATSSEEESDVEVTGEEGAVATNDASATTSDSADDPSPTEESSDDTPDLEPAAESHSEKTAESRSNARVNLDRPLIIRLSSGDTVKARLVNLSCGGLAFEYPAPAESGATLTVLFQLAGETDVINIQAEGIARHSHVKSESFVTGIQFTKISEEHVDIIEEFVEHKLSTAAQLTGFAVSHRHRS